MADIGRRSDMRLEDGARLLLRHAKGTTIRVTEGRLWVTQHHDLRDIVIDAGDVWTVERQGVTIVEATRPSIVTVFRPVAAPARLAIAIVRRASELAARISARASAMLDRRSAPYF